MELRGDAPPLPLLDQDQFRCQGAQLLLVGQQLGLGLLALGDVLGDAQQVFRGPIGPADADLPGMKQPLASLGRHDGLFRDVQHVGFSVEDFPVLGHEESGLLGREKVQIVLAEQALAVIAQKFFAGAIEYDEPQVCRFLEKDHQRDVLHDRIDQGFRFQQFPLVPFAIRDVLVMTMTLFSAVFT